jgi:hypothetical protein
MKPETTAQAETSKLQRVPYTPPQLTMYGSIAALTAGGSGQVLEGGSNPTHAPDVRP